MLVTLAVLLLIVIQTERIMSKISEYADRVKAQYAELDLRLTSIKGDVVWMRDEIVKLQNTAGQLTPEDQAILDGLEERANGAVTTAGEIDDMTTPPTPEA